MKRPSPLLLIDYINSGDLVGFLMRIGVWGGKRDPSSWAAGFTANAIVSVPAFKGGLNNWCINWGSGWRNVDITGVRASPKSPIRVFCCSCNVHLHCVRDENRTGRRIRATTDFCIVGERNSTLDLIIGSFMASRRLYIEKRVAG